MWCSPQRGRSSRRDQSVFNFLDFFFSFEFFPFLSCTLLPCLLTLSLLFSLSLVSSSHRVALGHRDRHGQRRRDRLRQRRRQLRPRLGPERALVPRVEGRRARVEPARLRVRARRVEQDRLLDRRGERVRGEDGVLGLDAARLEPEEVSEADGGGARSAVGLEAVLVGLEAACFFFISWFVVKEDGRGRERES